MNKIKGNITTFLNSLNLDLYNNSQPIIKDVYYELGTIIKIRSNNRLGNNNIKFDYNNNYNNNVNINNNNINYNNPNNIMSKFDNYNNNMNYDNFNNNIINNTNNNNNNNYDNYKPNSFDIKDNFPSLPLNF